MTNFALKIFSLEPKIRQRRINLIEPWALGIEQWAVGMAILSINLSIYQFYRTTENRQDTMNGECSKYLLKITIYPLHLCS